MTTKTKSDYAPGHTGISRDYRAEKGYVCDECRVNLKHATYCTNMHHKNGKKDDNSLNNLGCLCKLCHAEKHPNYPSCDEHRQIIEEARKKQGIIYPPIADGQGEMF